MSEQQSRGVALVTGSRRGIGRGVALCLAEAGFDIVINGTRVDSAGSGEGTDEVAQKIKAFGRRCHAVAADISDPDARARLLDETLAEFGRVDVLVNNAGVAPKVRMDMLETTAESFDRLIDINLRGPFFLTQAVANRMIEQQESGDGPGPAIIFVTSISAYVSSPARAEYCVSKAGLSMTARLFADRLAEHGINVYEVRPGIIATDMTSVVQEKYDKLIGEDGLLPQARWGTPEDVGKACVALATGMLSYSTGEVIEVGGGFNIPRL